MKKKFRKIVVEGADYTWAVTEIDLHEVLLKIWKAEKALWASVSIKFDLSSNVLAKPGKAHSIWPSDVAEIIKLLGDFDEAGKRDFVWCLEKGLRLNVAE